MNEEKIVNMYRDGKSTYDIAKENKTYPNKIRRILLKHGVKLKTKSEAQKNALKKGDSHLPTKGKKRTKEERLKISRGLEKRWKEIDKKTYDMCVSRAKKRWNTMTEEEKVNMRTLAIQAIQHAGKEGSKLEKYLKTELEQAGYKIEIHKKNLIQNQNLEIDMYLPGLKTIIEVDGPSHFLPIWGDGKLQKQIKSDEQKTGLILSKGLAIIRIKHLKDCLSLVNKETLRLKILDILTSIKQSFPEKSERFIEIEI